MSRWRAFTTHLLISAAVIATVAGFVLSLWYPPEQFRLGNLGRLIGILAIVDVVVGPIVTLIIFRQGKPGLKFDLAIIAILQLGLLGYGLNVLIGNRPIFMVWTGDRYELVTARDLADEDLSLAPPEYRFRSWTGPTTVAAVQPDDPEARQALIFEALAGKDIHLQPRYYRPLSEVPAAEHEKAQPLAELLPLLSEDERKACLRAADGRALDTLRFVPVTNAAREAALMLLDAPGIEPVGVVDLDPWEARSRTLSTR